MRNVTGIAFLTLEGVMQGPDGPVEDITGRNKYVLTRSDQPLEWANTHRLKSSEDVASLKQGDCPISSSRDQQPSIPDCSPPGLSIG